MPATKVSIRRVPREDGPLIRVSYLVAPPPGTPGKYQHFDFPPEEDHFEVPIEAAKEAIESGHFEVDPDSGMKPKASSSEPAQVSSNTPEPSTPEPQTPLGATEPKNEGGK